MDEMWRLGTGPLELVIRSVVVYLMLLTALRIFGKRELGQFTIFDLALVLLAANALQPAMTGPDASLPGALIIIVTVFTLNRIVAELRRRYAPVRRLLEHPVTIIGRDGSWIEAELDREGLDDQDLEAALREHGLGAVSEMRLAALEQDGSISIVPVEGERMSLRARHRRYRRQPNR